MPIVFYKLKVGGQLPGHIQGSCPQCKKEGHFNRYKVHGSIHFIPVPSSEAVCCPECNSFSRQESLLNKIINGIFLIPFVLILIGVFLTGLYFLGGMAFDSAGFSLGLSLVAVFLLTVAGYFIYRVTKYIYSMFTRKEFTPLSGLLTDM